MCDSVICVDSMKDGIALSVSIRWFQQIFYLLLVIYVILFQRDNVNHSECGEFNWRNAKILFDH